VPLWGFDSPTTTAIPDNNFRQPISPAGAESGAVSALVVPLATLDDVLALARRLDPADRRRLVELLLAGPTGQPDDPDVPEAVRSLKVSQGVEQSVADGPLQQIPESLDRVQLRDVAG
jgi:hypothetical protein